MQKATNFINSTKLPNKFVIKSSTSPKQKFHLQPDYQRLTNLPPTHTMDQTGLRVNSSMVGNPFNRPPRQLLRSISSDSLWSEDEVLLAQNNGDVATPISNRKHSQMMQTEFSCNANMCGVIDANTYEIICFYCHKIFPLKKWPFFTNHLKLMHSPLDESNNRADEEKMDFQISKETVQHSDIEFNNDCSNATQTFQRNRKRSMCYEEEYQNIEFLEEEPKTKKHISLHQSPLDSELSALCESPSDSLNPTNNNKDQKSKQTDTMIIDDNPMEYAVDDDITQISYNGQEVYLPRSLEAYISTDGKIATEAIALKQCSTFDEYIKSADVKEDEESPNYIALDERKEEPRSVEIIFDCNSTNSNDIYEEGQEDTTPSFEILETISHASQTCSETNTKKPMIQETIVSTAIEALSQPMRDAAVTTTIEALSPPMREPIVSTNTDALSMTTTATLSDSTRPMDFLSYYVDSEDEMPSNDENEDAFPSPTNCCGILFGLTNKQIVLEFLQQLGQYPCLYKFKKSQNVPMKSGQFQESITRLRTHINGKFNIDMSDVETRLSIQRIKHWYCRTLQAIEHSKECSKPYKHSFPVYFEMLNSYMSADVSYTRDLLFGRSVQNKDSNELTRYPRWMLCKKGTKSRRGKPIGRKRLIPKETNKERLPPQDDSVVLPLQEKFLVYDEIASSTETEEETVSETYNDIAVHPEPIICDICFVDFRHRLDLKRHRVRHFPPKHPCLICRRMHFTRPMANKCQHNDDSAELHTAEDNQLELNHHIWVCEICGSTYKTMGNLNYHKRNKHSSQRLKCGICGYGTIRTDNLLRHQQKFHTVEFGTCDEIAKRSRARPKIPFSIEARREYLWIQKMKAKLNPGIRFYGCFRCNKIFKSRQEKRAHNRKEHPITENTVVCLLCQHDNVLFANTTNLRRHYIDIHNVAIEDVESLLKHAKPLLKILSPDEVDYLQSSENHNQALEQILSKKPHMAARECISGTKLMYHQQVSQAALTSFDDDDDDSNDDLYESTLWEEVDQGYDELYAVKESQAVPELHEMEHHVKDELPEDMARGICIVQEHYANYYLEADAEQNLDAGQDDHLKCDDQVKTENFSDLIIEEIPEENFVSNEELEQYFIE